MAFTYLPLDDDPNLAAIGRVRLLITDTNAASPILQDDDIKTFLVLEDDSVKLAAAQAIDHIASRESLVQKRIKTLGLETDGPATAKDLRVHAASLRAQVKAGQDRIDELAGAEVEDFDFVAPASTCDWGWS